MSGESPLSSFARYTTCARTRSNDGVPTRKPDLEDTADDVQSADLDSTAPDRFASPNTDVDDIWKSERNNMRLACGRLWIEIRVGLGGNWEGTVRR